LGFDGKSTPGVPGHRLEAAIDVGPAGIGVRYELAYQSLTYLDRANLRPVAPRTLHDLYAHAEIADGLTAKLSITNLTDVTAERVPIPGAPGAMGVAKVDFLGYPLPGRALMLALIWSNP
jgi:outer membrane receptor protein involved in Fe transport